MGPVIVRVLSGTATLTDEAELQPWLAAESGRARELEQLRAIWQQAGALPQDLAWNTASLQQRILGTVATKVVPIRPDLRRPRFDAVGRLSARRPRWWLPAAVTAAAAIVLMTVGVWQWRVPARPVAPVAEPALTELATRRGQRATLQLSDGTRITLGVGSRLRYPEAFAQGISRDVYLEGEAYFEVAHDTLRPFRVHAGEAVTRVLGTRFGVRAYAEDRSVQVVVKEGRVALGRGAEQGVVLGRGDLGELAVGAAPTVRHGVDIDSRLAWADGRLVFVDTPMREVVQRLSRWYDLDVRLGNASLAAEPYTMSLRGDESPEHVLRVIAAAVGARLERRGAAYVISRK